jgi:DNA polymerase-1
MDDIVSKAREAGAAFTVCGRKRPIPGITHKNFRIRSQAERVAQNTPMQGSAADIMKLAMLDVDRVLQEKFPEARILLTVHDELVVEVEREEAESVGEALKRSMEGAYELRVPLVVDVGMANNWCDAH